MKERKAPQSKIPVQRAAIPVEDPAPEAGLSREQQTLRQKGGWSNVAVESPTKTEKEIVKENVFTFFNLIFLVLAVALLAVGSYKDATFIFIAVANTAISWRWAGDAAPAGSALWGGMNVGISSSLSSASRSMAAFAAAICPLWGGSKVPP